MEHQLLMESVLTLHLVLNAMENVIVIPNVLVIWSVSKEMGLQKYQAASQVDLVTSQITIFAFILNVRLLKQHKTKHLVVNLSNFTQM